MDFYDYPDGVWLYFYNPNNSATFLARKSNEKELDGIAIFASRPGKWYIEKLKHSTRPQPNYRSRYLKQVKRLGPYKIEFIKSIFKLESTFLHQDW